MIKGIKLTDRLINVTEAMVIKSKLEGATNGINAYYDEIKERRRGDSYVRDIRMMCARITIEMKRDEVPIALAVIFSIKAYSMDFNYGSAFVALIQDIENNKITIPYSMTYDILNGDVEMRDLQDYLKGRGVYGTGNIRRDDRRDNRTQHGHMHQRTESDGGWGKYNRGETDKPSYSHDVAPERTTEEKKYDGLKSMLGSTPLPVLFVNDIEAESFFRRLLSEGEEKDEARQITLAKFNHNDTNGENPLNEDANGVRYRDRSHKRDQLRKDERHTEYYDDDTNFSQSQEAEHTPLFGDNFDDDHTDDDDDIEKVEPLKFRGVYKKKLKDLPFQDIIDHLETLIIKGYERGKVSGKASLKASFKKALADKDAIMKEAHGLMNDEIERLKEENATLTLQMEEERKELSTLQASPTVIADVSKPKTEGSKSFLIDPEDIDLNEEADAKAQKEAEEENRKKTERNKQMRLKRQEEERMRREEEDIIKEKEVQKVIAEQAEKGRKKGLQVRDLRNKKKETLAERNNKKKAQEKKEKKKARLAKKKLAQAKKQESYNAPNGSETVEKKEVPKGNDNVEEKLAKHIREDIPTLPEDLLGGLDMNRDEHRDALVTEGLSAKVMAVSRHRYNSQTTKVALTPIKFDAPKKHGLVDRREVPIDKLPIYSKLTQSLISNVCPENITNYETLINCFKEATLESLVETTKYISYYIAELSSGEDKDTLRILYDYERLDALFSKIVRHSMRLSGLDRHREFVSFVSDWNNDDLFPNEGDREKVLANLNILGDINLVSANDGHYNITAENMEYRINPRHLAFNRPTVDVQILSSVVYKELLEKIVENKVPMVLWIRGRNRVLVTTRTKNTVVEMIFIYEEAFNNI